MTFSPTATPPTVMLVEDSATERKVLGDMLRNDGVEVLEAPDGMTALALALRTQPDLILMDIVMPGMNGFQATRQLSRNARTKHIPVIMISSKSMETDKLWAMRQGAKDYLVKPVDPQLLRHRVRQLVAS